VALLLATAPREAAAQAWVPPAHTWTVTFVTQEISHDGHLLDHGELDPTGKSRTVANDLVVGYAFTDRLSVDAGVPYIFAKFNGPPTENHPFLPVDSCFCLHSGFEDFTGTLRYNVIHSDGGFAVTPSIAGVIPSHAYEHVGEAVVGRDLRELRFGVDVGVPMTVVSPRLVVQGAYSYAVVERVLDIPNNRSNGTIEGDYRLTPKVTVSALVLWQRTHGGLQVADLIAHPEFGAEHDRLLRDDAIRLGGGASYSWGPWDLSGTYIGYTHGTNTHVIHALTFTLGWTKHN
jgi:hypothetical protein